MRIKIINPNTTQEMTDTIGECARKFARPGTQITSVSPSFGPASIESYVDEYISACGVLDEIKKSEEAKDADAYIIACYGDPGLHAAREMTEKPVVGIAEASLCTAAMLAARFSIVTIIPRARTLIEEMVKNNGMEHRVISIRTLPLHVLDVEADPEGSFEKIREGAHLAVYEDNAEAVCLGCAGFAEFAQSIEDELDVPVLDGVVCATKHAELLIELGKKTSKRMTYRLPEPKSYTGTFAHFSREVPHGHGSHGNHGSHGKAAAE